MSAVSLGQIMTLLPAGWVTDRLGVRAVISFGMIVGGVFLIAMLFTHSYLMALFTMFIVGLSLGLIIPGTGTGIVFWFPAKERAMAMGIRSMAVNLGGVLSAVTLPAVCIAYGWHMGFALLGITALTFGILSLILYKDPPGYRAEAGPTTVAEGAVRAPAAPARKRESSFVVLKSRDVWLLGIIGLGLSVNEFSLFSFYVLYLKEHMLLSVVAAGFVLGVVDTGGIFGKPVSGIISDRLFNGTRKEAFIILAATATIFTVVIALLPAGVPRWVLVVCSFVWGFAAVGWAGVWFTMSGEFGGKEHAGFVTGFTTAISTLAPVLGVPVFGYLADKTGTWMWSWVYAVAMAALATVLLFFVREERKALKV
jgi:sugar phosphate permease